MSKASTLILSLLLFVSCGEDKKETKTSSPRIRKASKIESPSQNQKFILGDSIRFEISAGEKSIDSVKTELNGAKNLFASSSFTIATNSPKVGGARVKLEVFVEGEKETHFRKVIFLPTEKAEDYTYEVVNTFYHDSEDYTQGLLISDEIMYESTGQNGHSTLKSKEIESGKVINQVNLADDFFGEGLALVNDQLYQLTYTSGACFVYNTSFERINSFSYQGEGWGLCEYEGNLLMTNGSEKIFVRDPSSFSILEELEVYDENGKVEMLNELEMIDGLIYANIYQTDVIVAIDPASGTVKRRIDLSGLLTNSEMSNVDVLNGIAYDQSNDRLFVTGKLWPKLFEIKFIPKNQVQ